MKKLQSILCLIGILLFTSCSNEILTPETEDTTAIIDNSITMEQAQNNLEKILADIETPSSRSAGRIISDSYSLKIASPKSRAEDGDFSVYVFNFSEDEGFAIMSADKRLPAMLALINKGSFHEGDSIANPGFRFFMSCLEKASVRTLEDDIDWDDTISGKTDWTGPWPYIEYGDWETTKIIDNVCKVKWGQTYPYNYYCPKIDGESAPTCCAVTALAQLMSIYKYPDSYAGYQFDWDEMCSFMYALGCSPTGIDQIARLMQQLGLPQNLNVYYGKDMSLAYMDLVPRTLVNFGYSNGGTLSGYSINKILTEVENGYPIIIKGDGGGLGHCWLIHGMMIQKRTVKELYQDASERTYTQTYYYPLCNMGFDGLYDGYYASGVFNLASGPYAKDDTISFPMAVGGSSNTDFSKNIQIVYGIRK